MDGGPRYLVLGHDVLSMLTVLLRKTPFHDTYCVHRLLSSMQWLPLCATDEFANVFKLIVVSFQAGLVSSYFISIFIMNTFQYLESNLHTLVVAILGKPRESSQVVNNKNCLNILIQLVKRTSEKVSYHCHARGKMLWVVNTWQTTGIYYNTHGKWTAARDISYLVMTS